MFRKTNEYILDNLLQHFRYEMFDRQSLAKQASTFSIKFLNIFGYLLFYRESFGKPMNIFQIILFKLSDMYCSIENLSENK